MRWKQFFIPVQSMDVPQAQKLINDLSARDLSIVDVRQPKEYEQGHIPGSRLVPLPELGDRLDELNPEQSTLVYCATGMRSSSAAQILAGQGYKTVYNLAGGFTAWNGEAAVGPETFGLELFSGSESLKDLIVIAYGLEHGLQELYESMQPKVENRDVLELFGKLAKIEGRHKKRLFREYQKLDTDIADEKDFEDQVVTRALEGGLSTEEVLNRLYPVQDSVPRILDLVMSVEAQALDLYQRAADRQPDKDGQVFLQQLVDEEKSHLVQLGRLLEQVS